MSLDFLTCRLSYVLKYLKYDNIQDRINYVFENVLKLVKKDRKGDGQIFGVK